MAFTEVSSPKSKKRDALKFSKLVKKLLILTYSLLYLGEPALPKLGSIILGIALGLALNFILDLSIKGI